ncbi:MAG: dicarboxylate/amino acid:cation symporter [Candidatus Marinimicrobia bacterium]|nr:dicarboxylate/amino acid:cation symporter [Candidatus Neomarinimicrobiota bacterium]
MTKLKLHWQILIAMVFGIGIGLYFQDTEFNSNKLYGLIASFGTIFVRLLKMIIVPLIFTSIITGVASIKDSSRLGRLGIKTLLYYTMTSLFAIIIGLTLTNLIEPGIGVELGSNGSFDASNLKTPGSPAEILIRMVPLNPFNAAARGDMLGIIFFAIFLGISISRVKNQQQSTLSNFFESMFQAIMKMTETIIKFVAPIGVLGLITKAVANSGFEIFTAVGKYMMTIAFGLSIHIFFVLPLFFFLMTKTNPMKHFKAISSAMATAFSTSSSSATLPVTMKCVKENAGVSNETASFVLPMGATVNMDGTALYECAGVIFISQVLGIDLSISQQFTVVITALLASIGAAGIPSAGLVMIFIVTQAVGFRDEDVALIIGTMLAVDRPLDMFRTMVNITSDSIGAAVIAKSEGEKLYQNS